MAEQKLCGVCGKVEATEVCSECGMPLCTACARKVEIPEYSLGYQMKGTAISPVRAGTKVKKVCPNCLAKIELE